MRNWHGTNCRDPSTQPHFPFGFAQGRSAVGRDDRGGWGIGGNSVVRFSVGMTEFGVVTKNGEQPLTTLSATRGCSGAGPSPAPVCLQERIRSRTMHANCSGSGRARGIRDGISRGRESGREMHLARAGEIVLVELPDAAWHGTNSRDPSTQPHLPFGRSVFGRDDKG